MPRTLERRLDDLEAARSPAALWAVAWRDGQEIGRALVADIHSLPIAAGVQISLQFGDDYSEKVLLRPLAASLVIALL